MIFSLEDAKYLENEAQNLLDDAKTLLDTFEEISNKCDDGDETGKENDRLIVNSIADIEFEIERIKTRLKIK